MLIKKSRIKENPVPKRCQPLDMEFVRDMDNDSVIVSVTGGKGGLKARFHVSYTELKDAVNQLEGG